MNNNYYLPSYNYRVDYLGFLFELFGIPFISCFYLLIQKAGKNTPLFAILSLILIFSSPALVSVSLFEVLNTRSVSLTVGDWILMILSGVCLSIEQVRMKWWIELKIFTVKGLQLGLIGPLMACMLVNELSNAIRWSIIDTDYLAYCIIESSAILLLLIICIVKGCIRNRSKKELKIVEVKVNH